MPNSQGESKSGLAAAPAGAVFERQHSAVSFGDLAAEREANARPAGFGGEERDEEVRGVGQSGAFVFDRDFEERVGARQVTSAPPVALILELQPQAASRARATKRQGLKGAGYLLPKASDISSPGSDPPPPLHGLCRALPPHRAEPEGRPCCLRPRAPRPSKPPLPPGLANSPAMNLDSFSSTCSSLAPFLISLSRRPQLVL